MGIDASRESFIRLDQRGWNYENTEVIFSDLFRAKARIIECFNRRTRRVKFLYKDSVGFLSQAHGQYFTNRDSRKLRIKMHFRTFKFHSGILLFLIRRNVKMNSLIGLIFFVIPKIFKLQCELHFKFKWTFFNKRMGEIEDCTP